MHSTGFIFLIKPQFECVYVKPPVSVQIMEHHHNNLNGYSHTSYRALADLIKQQSKRKTFNQGYASSKIAFMPLYLPEQLRRSRWLSPQKRLEWYPPFRRLNIRVLHLSDDWQQLHILLPLNKHNRNPGGSMFGGAIALLADPIPALCCNRVFPGHSIWTRAMALDFRKEARTDLVLKFTFDNAQRHDIQAELQQRKRATPTFEFAFYDMDNHLCTNISNTVAIRPEHYQPPIKGTLDDK